MIPKPNDGDNREPPEHDPETCGLDDGAYCPGCAALPPRLPPLTPMDQAQERWRELSCHYWRLLKDANRDCHGRMPEPMEPETLGAFVVTLLHPDYRPLLREVLLDLLGVLDETAPIRVTTMEDAALAYLDILEAG